MECDGYDEHGNVTPAMVIIVMLHNYISHVWHRLDANLEMKASMSKVVQQVSFVGL